MKIYEGLVLLGIASFLVNNFWIFKEYKNKEIGVIVKLGTFLWSLSGLFLAVEVLSKLEYARTLGLVIPTDSMWAIEVIRTIVFVLAIGSTLYGQYKLAIVEDNQEALKKIKTETKGIIILLIGVTLLMKFFSRF